MRFEGMLDKYQSIRERVTAQEAAERYGVHINRYNKACCIWHEERTPSLSFKDGYCHCFACGRGGTAIDVTMQLFRLSTMEAAQKIDQDFMLGLFLDKPLAAAEHQRIQEATAKRKREKAQLAAFEKWCDRALDTVAWFLRYLEKIKEYQAPKTIDDMPTAAFCYALRELATVEYLYDMLAFGEFVNKALVYKYWRKEVEGIERFRKDCRAA